MKKGRLTQSSNLKNRSLAAASRRRVKLKNAIRNVNRRRQSTFLQTNYTIDTNAA